MNLYMNIVAIGLPLVAFIGDNGRALAPYAWALSLQPYMLPPPSSAKNRRIRGW